jgi:hypothetical protein
MLVNVVLVALTAVVIYFARREQVAGGAGVCGPAAIVPFASLSGAGHSQPQWCEQSLLSTLMRPAAIVGPGRWLPPTTKAAGLEPCCAGVCSGPLLAGLFSEGYEMARAAQEPKA